jgi:hypothetical protein
MHQSLLQRVVVLVLCLSTTAAWATDADWVPDTTAPVKLEKPMPPHWLALGLGATVRDTTYGVLQLEYAQDPRWSVGATLSVGWRNDDVRRLQAGVVSGLAEVRQYTVGLEGAWYAYGTFDRGVKLGLFGVSLAMPVIRTPPAGSSTTATWYPVGDGFALGPMAGGRYTLQLSESLPFALTGDLVAGVGFAAVTAWQHPADADLSKRADGLNTVDAWFVQPYVRAAVGVAF